LGPEWEEAGGKDTWPHKANVKIFSYEEEYKKYRNAQDG